MCLMHHANPGPLPYIIQCNNMYTGMRGVADFTSSDASVTIETPAGRRKKRFSFSSFIPTILKGIQCLGSEKSVGSCVLDAVTDVISENFLALPPGTSRSMTVGDVGYVSCLGMYLSVCNVSYVTLPCSISKN